MNDEKEVVKTETPEATAEVKKDKVENMTVETYQPNKKCKKCYGRGHIGFIDGDPRRPYPCRCLVKVKKIITPVKGVAKPGEQQTEATVEQQVEVKNEVQPS